MEPNGTLNGMGEWNHHHDELRPPNNEWVSEARSLPVNRGKNIVVYYKSKKPILISKSKVESTSNLKKKTRSYKRKYDLNVTTVDFQMLL